MEEFVVELLTRVLILSTLLIVDDEYAATFIILESVSCAEHIDTGLVLM